MGTDRWRRVSVSAAAVALVVLAGCGGGGGEVAGNTSSSEGTVAVTGSGSTDAPATTPKGRSRVERPSGTPDGPIFPPGTPAYRLLAEGRCQELLQTVDRDWQKAGKIVVTEEAAFYLYRAAAEACLGRWDDARSDFEKLTATKPSFTGACGDSQECAPCKEAVLRWLTEQIQARRRDPGFAPVYVKGSGTSPCPETTTTSGEQGTTSSRPTTTSRQTTTTA